MNRRWLVVGLAVFGLAGVILGCTPQSHGGNTPRRAVQTPPPTPSTEALRVSGTSAAGARLRVTLPSIKLLKPDLDTDVQLFLVLADPRSSYSYLVYPANRPGDHNSQFDLTGFPLELSVADNTAAVTLWVLAIHNSDYHAAEAFGLDDLAASLGIGFRNWLRSGDPQDDPLAAVISASGGTLYEWFASTEVLGQSVITFQAGDNWNIGLDSRRSPDGGLNVVYSVQYISAADATLLPTPTPLVLHPGYTLHVDETFANATSTHQWYEGQDSTYVNSIVNGAYEIRLTQIVERDFGLSWGSMDDEQFHNYILEATVSLAEDNVTGARYGIWFDYKDDYNFIYFGISNTGEYRVAVIQSNSSRIEVQNWTPSPAIRPGAATNVLTIETDPDKQVILSVNGQQLTTFTNNTFDGGSIAFFCYAESVPATCRLEHLRIWEKP